MARAITAPELTYLRRNGQFSLLYLVIDNPPVVYSARINQAFTDWDQITQIAYDSGGGGTLANVLPGMTLWIGSSAGAYDKGQVRIRKLPTSTIFYIGETSDVAFADNDYLTIVDEFAIWARHIRIISEITFADWDIAYTDQHKNPDPVVNMGADVALWLDGATVSYSPAASDSWIASGTIASYLWTAPGASATSGMNTATPTITYNTSGRYRITCTATATTTGKTFTGYRVVTVVNGATLSPAVTQFTLKSCDYSDGGWTFSASMYAEAGLTTVRDRAKVILFARDYYGGTKISLGPIPGVENVVCEGWIEGQSIHWNPELSQVEFTVRGPDWWLDKVPGFPTGVKDSTADPRQWTSLASLTVDKGLWHHLAWRSTALNCIDVYKTGDTRRTSACEGSAGSLWKQIKEIAENQILASPICDRYGRLFIEIDSQYLAVGDRTGIPVIQEITSQDWMDAIDFERVTVPPTAMVDISGVAWSGSVASPYFSRAAGKSFKRQGDIQTVDRLLLSSQAQCNALCGSIMAKLNNEYPDIPIRLASNNRMIDAAPLQYVTLSLATGDTPRGVSFTTKKFIPRSISYNYDENTGMFQTDLSVEGETIPGLVVTILRPQPATNNTPPTPPTPPNPITPTPNPVTPPIVAPPPTGLSACSSLDSPANGPFDTRMEGCLYNGTYTEDGILKQSIDLTVPYLAALRDPDADFPSRYLLRAVFQKYDPSTGYWTDDPAIIGLDESYYEVQILNDLFTVVARGLKELYGPDNYKQQGGFDNVVAVDFDYVNLHMNAGTPTTTLFKAGCTLIEDLSKTVKWRPNPTPGSTTATFELTINENLNLIGSVDTGVEIQQIGGTSAHTCEMYLKFILGTTGGLQDYFPRGSRWHITGLGIWHDLVNNINGADREEFGDPRHAEDVTYYFTPKWNVRFTNVAGDGYTDTIIEGDGNEVDIVMEVPTDLLHPLSAGICVSWQVANRTAGATPESRNFYGQATLEPALGPADRRICVDQLLLYNLCGHQT